MLNIFKRFSTLHIFEYSILMELVVHFECYSIILEQFEYSNILTSLRILIFLNLWTVFKQFWMFESAVVIWCLPCHLTAGLRAPSFHNENSLFVLYQSGQCLIIRLNTIQKFRKYQYCSNYSKTDILKHFWIISKHSDVIEWDSTNHIIHKLLNLSNKRPFNGFWLHCPP